MLDKDKLLQWIKFGLDRAEAQKSTYQDVNEAVFNSVVGGETILQVLLQQIESGTFDATNKE